MLLLLLLSFSVQSSIMLSYHFGFGRHLTFFLYTCSSLSVWHQYKYIVPYLTE